MCFNYCMQQILLLPIGAILGIICELFYRKYISSPKIELLFGGDVTNPSNKIITFHCDVKNYPLSHRFLRFKGSRLDNLTATISYEQKTDLILPNNNIIKGARGWTTSPLKWLDLENYKIGDEFEKCNLSSGSWSTLSLFDRNTSGKYDIHNTKDLRFNKSGKFTITLKNDDGFYYSKDIAVQNYKNELKIFIVPQIRKMKKNRKKVKKELNKKFKKHKEKLKI